MKNKYKIFILLIFGIFSSSIYFFSKDKILETYQSPDKRYILEVIEENFYGDNDVVKVKLKNAAGKKIGSLFQDKCTTSFQEIEVRWSKEYVMYARGHAIYFETGECE